MSLKHNHKRKKAMVFTKRGSFKNLNVAHVVANGGILSKIVSIMATVFSLAHNWYTKCLGLI